MSNIKRLIIGIDADVDKNGVACYFPCSKSLQLLSLSFFDLFDLLRTSTEEIKEVIIEGGWLISKSNFHNEHSGVRVAARIGNNTGSNHETGRKIVEMCEYLGIPYRVKKPLKKMWRGKDGKITHDEFVKLTGITAKRSNQETRDAALLVWGL